MNKLVIGVVTGGAALAIGYTTPVAHADYTWTVQQVCEAWVPGLVPKYNFGTSDVACSPRNLSPGLFVARGTPIPDMMAKFRPGSRPVDPGNPWSDWIIPD